MVEYCSAYNYFQSTVKAYLVMKISLLCNSFYIKIRLNFLQICWKYVTYDSKKVVNTQLYVVLGNVWYLLLLSSCFIFIFEKLFNIDCWSVAICSLPCKIAEFCSIFLVFSVFMFGQGIFCIRISDLFWLKH